jgi:ferrous iron transport protein B
MYTIALAGNPNTGKSTLFNALTGYHQHTGNWPGKTVEQKVGNFKYNDQQFEVVDLPGTYSLTAVSTEEIIARDFIVTNKPEVVIVVADATNLERNLYLITQIMELTGQVVVALNMTDQLQSKGMCVDVEKLSSELGVPFIPIIALKKEGLTDLMDTVVGVQKKSINNSPRRIVFNEQIESMIGEIENFIQSNDEESLSRWLAIKLLEGDSEVTKMLQKEGNQKAVDTARDLVNHFEQKPEIVIASDRYNLISQIAQKAIFYDKEPRGITEKIDNIVTHKIWGIPILFLIASLTLWAIYNIAGPIGGLFEIIFEKIISWASSGLADVPFWLSGIIVDGILVGVQQLFVFMLGVLFVFFFIYGILEDVGYLARGAFVMDRIMRWFGLPGKAFLTIFAGFGCSIPGIMGTRIIDDEKDRITTAIVVPFIPCAARIAVITAIVPIFFGFGINATLVTIGILGLSFLTIAIVAYLMKKTAFKGEETTLIMEFPDYHPPLLSNVLRTTWNRTYSAMSRALVIFVPFSILIWVLFNFPVGAAQDATWGMHIGHFLDPIGKIIGLSGKDMTGFLFSYPAKELSLLYLGLSHGVGGEEGVLNLIGEIWSPLQALSYLAFLTLYAPCLATVASLLKEVGKKWTIYNVLISLAAGFFFSALIYWGGRLFIR